MAFEIWTSPINSINQKPPEGEGWQITGYSTKRIPMNPNRMGSGFRTEQVPIYGRLAPAPAPPPPPPAPAPAPAPNLSIQQNGLDVLNRPLTPADRAPLEIVQKEPPKPELDVAKMLEEMQIASRMQMDSLMQNMMNQQAAQQAALQSSFEQQRQADAAAREAQMKQMEETQRTYAINQSRSSAAKNLQIEGASSGGGIGGTAPFKIRKQGSSLQGSSPIKLASTLNI